MRMDRLSTAALVVVALATAHPYGYCAVKPLFKGAEAIPSDAVVLFNGRDLSGWTGPGGRKPEWKVVDGYMEVVPGAGNIRTRSEFGDFQLHIEFMVPYMPENEGQHRGNSGVYLQGSYEVQVLDSYGLASQTDDCGGIYDVSGPMVNACRPPGEWQTYDILFYAPRFDDDGKLTVAGRITVLQNGVWIQNNTRITDSTSGGIDRPLNGPGPLMLQDHACPVRYRNIWLRPL